jgi:putative transposase
VSWAIQDRSYTQRRACRLVGLEQKTYRYASKRPDDGALRQRLKELASERRRFGYRRLHILLRREGIVLNHKKLYRLYREERLMVGKRGGRWEQGRRWRSPKDRTSAGHWTSCLTHWLLAASSGC